MQAEWTIMADHKEDDITIVVSDSLNEERLRTDGFTIIELLTESDVEHLRAVLQTIARPGDQPFWLNVTASDLTETERLSRKIVEVIKPRLDRFLDLYSIVGSMFIVKAPVDGSEVPLHQDRSAVDEAKARSFNCWCPLVDVNSTNGCLEVVVGSHRWVRNVRSAEVRSFEVPFDALDPDLTATIELRAGQAFLYDNRLMHGSRANSSGSVRPAVQVGLVPKLEKRLMALGAKGDVDYFEVDDSAFTTGKMDEGPPSYLVHSRVRSANYLQPDADQIISLIRFVSSLKEI